MTQSPEDLPPLSDPEDPQAAIDRLEAKIRETFPDLLSHGEHPIDVAIATFGSMHNLVVSSPQKGSFRGH